MFVRPGKGVANGEWRVANGTCNLSLVIRHLSLKAIRRSQRRQELLRLIPAPALVFEGQGVVELYPSGKAFIVAVLYLEVGVKEALELVFLADVAVLAAWGNAGHRHGRFCPA